ncbi:MAG: TrkA C-terminal domain-containing protein [Oscillospiraceae bacterium]|nr:TrkA C-terminal domain-containing protein [Oscillospiraceae bacterium]
MNIYVAFSLFALVILLYWVIAELITVLFRFTGLPDEKARFQVLSLLTGTGFTTRESEMILLNRRRRRLGRATILFGYVFNLTIVTAFINIFVSLRASEAEHELLAVLLPLGALAIIFICMRIPVVRSWTDEKLEKLADRFFGLESGNTVMLLDYIGENTIAQVRLKTVPDELRNDSLSGLHLRAHGVNVLLIEHGGQPELALGTSTLADGDRLTVFGEYGTICRTFHARERFFDDEYAEA